MWGVSLEVFLLDTSLQVPFAQARYCTFFFSTDSFCFLLPAILSGHAPTQDTVRACVCLCEREGGRASERERASEGARASERERKSDRERENGGGPGTPGLRDICVEHFSGEVAAGHAGVDERARATRLRSAVVGAVSCRFYFIN